jgi:hypothetical protein
MADAVNFLLDKPNIQVHMEDFNGRDCCDVVKGLPQQF